MNTKLKLSNLIYLFSKIIYKNDVFVTINFGISFFGSIPLLDLSRFFIPALPCFKSERTSCLEIFSN